MKVAKVRWYNDEVCENLFIETTQDVLDYQQHLVNNTSLTFSKMIDDRIPLERWDHYGHEGEYGNSFNMSVQKCKIFGGRPLLEFDKVTNEKCLSILECILKGQKVVVNRVGGWCPVMDSIHEVLEVSGYSPKSDKKVVINTDTRYINLENDPRLEKRTKEYLSSVDKNYSYVLRLCEYQVQELIKIFEDFRAAGGHTVYVYTTGSNVVQMYEYCEAIIRSGLKRVEFEFNSGYDNVHKQVVAHLQENGVEVKIIGELS